MDGPPEWKRQYRATRKSAQAFGRARDNFGQAPLRGATDFAMIRSGSWSRSTGGRHMRRALIVCVVAVLIGAAPLVGSAQTAPKRVGGHPNLNGLWQSMSTAYWNLEGHAASPLNDFWRLGSIAAIPAGQSVVKEG